MSFDADLLRSGDPAECRIRRQPLNIHRMNIC
jgi:hypothetical protein